jgi:hypothetical protein
MSDAEYYAQRERDERALAAIAKTPEIRAIHNSLADKYAELARRDAGPGSDQPDAGPIGAAR